MTSHRSASGGSHGYPRPMLRRDGWINLNGPWDFAIDPVGRWIDPRQVVWLGQIIVPFSPESARSGIGETGYFQSCWYRRWITCPELRPGERLILHFGAVDYLATIWVDGVQVMTHEGGYTPFSVDLTLAARPGQSLEIVVRAHDDPHDLSKPRGKQDWQLHPHSIWYPRTTGIWQTVWLERLPPAHVSHIKWSSNLARWEIAFAATVTGAPPPDIAIRLRLRVGERLLAEDVYECTHHEVHRRIPLSDPGIDDARNELLWSPEAPTLIDARVEVITRDGAVLDAFDSYTAIRTIAVHNDQILLNGRPIRLRMVLDQGYWPESGITAPDDDALRRDVELAKMMGFNAVRKHQKIEDPRYLYWADRLGLLVWEEMPSAYRFTADSVQRLTREWMRVIARDMSHPCIIAWVPFNESWGVPNLPDNPAERNYVTALYHLTKTLDPSRPVVGNDGWESVATDIVGIHDYEVDPARLGARYQAPNARTHLYERERFGGRSLVIETLTHTNHPVVLSEFGGIALSHDESGTWGYARSSTPRELERRLVALFDAIRDQNIFAGYCYTQFADTYQEANGLLHADRTPKLPIERIAALNGITRTGEYKELADVGQEV